MTLDLAALLAALDTKIDPFLRSLGDAFFRQVGEARRANISGNPADAQTETDLAVERAVMDFLGGLADFPVLSEESAKLDDAREKFAAAPAYWVCDPIDGTTYFQRLEYGEFSTLLSLVQGGVIVAAWGYWPGETKEADCLIKSLTPDTVLIDGVPVMPVRTPKMPADYAGRFGISKSAHYVTAEDRATFDANKKRIGMTAKPRVPGHSTALFARGRLDFFAHIGTHPWDFTTMGKFVTALGGQVYKFDETRGVHLYEGDVILDDTMMLAAVMPGIDYNAAIAPLFAGTRWEKTCLLPPPM